MYPCQFCALEFSTASRRQYHLITVHDIRHKCKLCYKICTSNVKLEDHMRTHTGERPFKCDVCPNTYGNRQSLRAHLNTHLGNAGKVHKCSICGKCFNAISNLHRHKTTTHTQEKRFQCDKCPSRFKSKAELKVHDKRHMERSHSCTKCPFKFHTSTGLRRHMSTHDPDSRHSVKCPLCDKMLSSKDYLRSHVKFYHNPTGVDLNIYRCLFCGKGHKNASHLHDHIRTHTNEKPYKCEICGREFSKNRGKVNHIKRIHTAERVDKCNQCGKLFKIKEDLARHVLRHPKPMEACTCEICGKVLVSEKHLIRHKKLFHLRCMFCEKICNGRRQLFRHIRVHTKERPVSCELCGKEYPTAQEKNFHLICSHTLEKPYSCNICGFKFALKYRLANHLRTHE